MLASAGRGDWILCQVTSNPYSDTKAVEIVDSDFENGSLHRVSYARPGKLFTCHETLIVSRIGNLDLSTMDRVLGAIFQILAP